MDGREYSRAIKTHILEIERTMGESGHVSVSLIRDMWVASFVYKKKRKTNMVIEPCESETLNNAVYKLKLLVRRLTK